MLSDMGITVVESEEAEEGAAAEKDSADDAADDADEGGRAVVAPSLPADHQRARRADRPHRRSRAHVPARHGLGGAALARGRDRHCQAHRGRPRGDDRRPVREPAHLPGHHHLARRAQQRQAAAARHHRPGGHLRGARGQERAPAHALSPSRPPPARPAAAAGDGRWRRASRAPKARWTTRTISRTPCRSPPWRPSSSPRCSRPSTTSPAPTRSCSKLQDKRVEMHVANEQINAPAAEDLRQGPRRDHQGRQEPLAQQRPHRDAGGAALQDQPQPGAAGEPPDAAGRQLRRAAAELHRRVLRQRAGPGLARAHGGLRQPQVGAVHQAREAADRQHPRGDQDAGRGDGARDHRVPPHRQGRAEGRARGAPGQEGDGGGQPAPRHLDRQEVHQPRPAVPGPDPGGQHRPDEGGRQVRVPPRLQVLDLRHVVDPAGDHARASPIRRAPSASPCT